MTKQMKTKLRHGFGSAGLLILAILYSFPIIYMVYASFKPERDVAPANLSTDFTLENYQTVINSDLLLHLQNSIVASTATVALTVIFGVPIAYVIVFGRLKKPAGMYNWYITTTILPAVAVIIPLYVIFSRMGWLDNLFVLTLLYTATGIPMMVWMCTTYMLDVPLSILEASEIDGCNRWQTFWKIIVPITKGGIVSTSLLVFILTWNEFLFAVAFTYTNSGTLPVFMNQYLTQQGLFWAKMSAAATIAVLIPVLLGFFAQKSLIKGLLTGAVKE